MREERDILRSQSGACGGVTSRVNIGYCDYRRVKKFCHLIVRLFDNSTMTF